LRRDFFAFGGERFSRQKTTNLGQLPSKAALSLDPLSQNKSSGREGRAHLLAGGEDHFCKLQTEPPATNQLLHPAAS
jgi:hypothetical protein